MATVYSVADGSDNEAGYVALSPQPSCKEGIQGEYIIAASGKAYQRGASWCILEYTGQNGGAIPASQYDSLLSQFGVTTSVVYNDITIALPDTDRTTFSDYNATVYHYQSREYRTYESGFYRNVRFRVVITGTT